jgi:hypothetical protein
MKRILPTLLLPLALLAIAQQALAVTNISGILTGVNTFAKANSPYIVTANLLVDEGAQLIIEPGTEIRVDANVKFYVDGAVLAIGTATDPIIFMSNAANPTRGSWDGLELRIAGNADSSVFDHCYFSSANTPVYAKEGFISFTNCKIAECVTAFHVSSNTVITKFLVSNNIIEHCGWGIDVGGIGTVSANQIAHVDQTAIIAQGNVTIAGNDMRYGGSGIEFRSGMADIAHNKAINLSGTAYEVWASSGSSGIPTVHHNLSVNSGGIGYYINMNGSVEHNTSIHDKIGVQGVAPVFKSNCITLSTQYFLKIDNPGDVDASGNYWGTTDTAILSAMVFDYYDNFTSGKAQMLPVLGQPAASCQTYTSVNTTKADAIAITVSPNPFVNSFVIDLHGRATELTVFNMAGQQIVSLDVTGRNKMEVDMSAYPAGMYHYRATVAGQPAVTGKLIKQ